MKVCIMKYFGGKRRGRSHQALQEGKGVLVYAKNL